MDFSLRRLVTTVLCLAPFTLAVSPAATATDGWAVVSPTSMGLVEAPLSKLEGAIQGGEFPKTTSVLIVYRGKLVYEHYFGVGSAELLNDTRSATKSITSLGLGAAIQNGAIKSVAAPAFSYLSDLAPFKNDTELKRAITIEDFLTMSSALACNDDIDGSPGNEDRMHEQTNWARWAVDLPTNAQYLRDATGRGPFSYCTAGAFLLGQIIQRAAHQPVDQYIESKILKPLGILEAEWPRSPSGEVMTGGGLRLRSRDLAKIAWMLVDDGNWRDQCVIAKTWINAAMTARRQALPDSKFGYLFWNRIYSTANGPVSGWYMAGNGGNAIVILRDLHAAVVVTRQNYNTHGMHQQTIELLERYALPALAHPQSTP